MGTNNLDVGSPDIFIFPLLHPFIILLLLLLLIFLTYNLSCTLNCSSYLTILSFPHSQEDQSQV